MLIATVPVHSYYSTKYHGQGGIAIIFLPAYDMIENGRKRDVEAKKPLGRPRAARRAGERSTLSLRITADLFQKLDSAAKKEGRPLSNEAELRLQQSFRDQQIVERTLALAYGDQLAGLLLTIAAMLKESGPIWGIWSTRTSEGSGDWLSDPYAFDQTIKAVDRLLEGMKPPGEMKIPRDLGYESPENMGQGFANTMLMAIGGFPHDGNAKATEPLREMLGPIADRVRAFVTTKLVPKRKPAVTYGKRRSKST
jgi:hypothetical protein